MANHFFNQICLYLVFGLLEAKMIVQVLATPLQTIYKMKVWIVLSQPRLNSNLKHYYLTFQNIVQTNDKVTLTSSWS